MSLGIECLLCEDEALARDMATQLDELNKDRKAIEQGMQREALAQLGSATGGPAVRPVPVRAGLAPGVIGILASRLERYHRPTIAFADAGDGLLKGSARSVPGFHIRDALDAVAARHPGLISKFGGHAMAAGLSLPQANFGAFAAAFDAEVRRQLCEDDLTGRLLTDGQLSVEEFHLELARALRNAGPWGQHFPEPMFHGVFQLVQQRIVGERHLKLVLKSECGSLTLDGIAFNVDREIWPNPTVRWAELAYKLDVNEYRGQESVQLMVATSPALTDACRPTIGWLNRLAFPGGTFDCCLRPRRLEWRDNNSAMREPEMSDISVHHRACHLCEAICGLTIQTEGERILSIKGDPSTASAAAISVRRQWRCRTSRTTPIACATRCAAARDEWQAISWEEAYELVAERLAEIRERHGSNAVAIYQGNRVCITTG